MWDVSVTRCGSYEMDEARRALAEVLEPVGGLDWVKSGMKVAIKANLVTFLRPERAATTHPALLCALVERIRARGAEAVVGDSPGGLYTAAYVNRIYAATGMRQVEEAGGALNRDFREAQADFPSALAAKRFTYTAWLEDADAIINFCKLKSHGMMGMSAAVKNLFGVIPGTMKPEYHFQYPNEADFANMLVDLNEYFHPGLCIVDAVVGMEGNGPTAGNPRQIGALLASQNPYALDLVCADLIGATADDVPTIRASQARGLCPETLDEVRVSGDLDGLKLSDFKLIKSHHSLRFQGTGNKIQKWTGKAIEIALASKPGVEKDRCVGCGVCARTCPAHAIQMTDRRPKIDRGKCIRCFCCQEFCPKGAMVVRRPAVARLLNREG